MKRVSLILAVSISLLACNQSEDKEIGTVESVNPSASTKPDTTAASPSVAKVDTTKTTTPTNAVSPDTQKTAAPVVTLQNFWALESVDGKLLNPTEFPNGTPYFEINLKKNKISGHVGCNGVNGSIRVQGNNIVFSNFVTTKATCPAQNFENKYVKDLSGHTIRYTIDANARLILIVPPNSQYVYRKMQ